MTENEQKIIKKISDLSGDYKCYDNRISRKESLVLDRLLTEIQQYRAIGTVNEIQQKLKNMSLVIDVDRDLLNRYMAIGTMDEFMSLKESKCKYWNAEHEDCALNYEDIRAKVIDEFAERLKPIIDEKIKGWTNSDDLRRWCKRSIDEIAEQMKGGAS